MRVHVIKKLLHTKGKNGAQRQLAAGEDIFTSSTFNKGLISGIYTQKGKHQNIKKSNDLINKWANEQSFKKETQIDNGYMEKGS